MSSNTKGNSSKSTSVSVVTSTISTQDNKASAAGSLQAGSSYSIVGDAKSDPILSRLDELLNKAVQTLLKSVEQGSAVKPSEVEPWTIVRTGSRFILYLPSNFDPEDPLSSTIMVLASKAENVAFATTVKAYDCPSYTTESRKMLNGIVAAMQGAPLSFSAGTDPTQNALVAVWITACSMAVSEPDCPREVQSLVIPNRIGSDSSRKYLTKIFSVLKACGSGSNQNQAIGALDSMLRNWCRTQFMECHELIRRQKIAWKVVLDKGGTWDRKKTKQGEVKKLRVPSKPNSSPWLSNHESKIIGDIYKTQWSCVEDMAKAWNKLSAEEQHTHFHEYVTDVRTAYTNMFRISASVNAKFGHRKRHILSFLTENSLMPTKKAEKLNNFLLGQKFFVQDLTSLKPETKILFYPLSCLATTKEDESQAMHDAVQIARNASAKVPQTFDASTNEGKLRDWWLKKFEPTAKPDEVWNPATCQIETRNAFNVLGPQSS